MCILSYLPPAVPVDEDGLLNGGANNPDGHGWAIADGDTMLVGKSLELIEALDDFMTARQKHPNGHALFHSRWATHGRITTDNVHPFYAGHSETTVVAHNGVLPSAAWPAKGDERSDTRKFADELLSTRYRRLNRDRVRQALTDWVGSGNKLVILTVDPRYTRNAFIINQHLGNWDKHTGIWHSNYDYERMPWWYYSKSKGKAAALTTTGYEELTAENTDEPCLICEYGRVNDKTQYCSECGTCQDCMETKRDCMCFSRYKWLAEDPDARDYEEGTGDWSGYRWDTQNGMLIPITERP